MSGLRAAGDPIDRAIAGNGAGPREVDMAGPIQMQLSSGRPAVLFVPKDLTSREALSLINGVLQVAEQLHAAAQAKRSRIVPASVLPRSLRRG